MFVSLNFIGIWKYGAMFCLKLMPFIGVIWKYAAVYLDFGSLSVFFFLVLS
jgi:hypothetical protein